MRILFVYVNFIEEGFLPMGVASLSGALKLKGHETDMFDSSFWIDESSGDNRTDRETGEKYHEYKKVGDYSFKRKKVNVINEFRNKIKEFNPDLIACTSTSHEFNDLLKILNVKLEFNIPVIVGGPHATVAPDSVISNEYVDIICRGEGEGALVELVDKMKNGSDITDIKNLWVKKNGKVYKNDVRPYVQNLDELPIPDWGLFDSRHHIRPFEGKLKKYCFFESSRGCAYKCTYCINKIHHDIYHGKGKTVRFKSIKRIIDELKSFRKLHEFNHVQFVDDNFLSISNKDMKDFAERYSQEIGVPFFIMAYPHNVTEAKADLLLKAGCIMVAIGVESGNDRIRNEICKRSITKESMVLASERLRKRGIMVSTYNIIGFPSETRENIFETIKLNRMMQPDRFSVRFLYPYPGTELREECIEKGYMDENQIPSSYLQEPILNLPQITKEELKGLKKTFAFYLKFPERFWPLIEECEKDDTRAELLFDLFSKVYTNEKEVN
jgi:anaerobic magnesium-protoporphyrin IX monomethyl ester cyclase